MQTGQGMLHWICHSLAYIGPKLGKWEFRIYIGVTEPHNGSQKYINTFFARKNHDSLEHISLEHSFFRHFTDVLKI